jgi:hypothetical protein
MSEGIRRNRALLDPAGDLPASRSPAIVRYDVAGMHAGKVHARPNVRICQDYSNEGMQWILSGLF